MPFQRHSSQASVSYESNICKGGKVGGEDHIIIINITCVADPTPNFFTENAYVIMVT